MPFDTLYNVPQKGYKVLGMIDGPVYGVIDLSGATRPDLLAVLDRAFNKKVTTHKSKTIERCYQAMQAGARWINPLSRFHTLQHPPFMLSQFKT